MMEKDIKDFLKVCKELYSRGYRRNFTMRDLFARNQSGLFCYYYKVIDRAEDKYGDKRAINQLLFRVWSFWQYRDRLPELTPLFSFEPVVMFSRETEERIDMSLQYPARSIDECEELAKEFGEWAKKNVRVIRDE